MALLHLNNPIQMIDEMFESRIIKLRRKRSQLLHSIQQLRTKQMVLLLNIENQTKKRKIEPGFWETNCANCDASFFKKHFRMSKNSFETLCDMLQGMGKANTSLMTHIQREKRIAIALHILGSTQNMRAISDLYKVDTSTAFTILRDFCSEVMSALGQRYMVDFATDQEKIEECLEGFNELGFPQCLGAVGRCSVILQQAKMKLDAVTLTLAVDYRGRFLYVARVPNQGIDESIISLEKQLQESPVIDELIKSIDGMPLPVYLLADSSFQLSEQLLTPFPSNFTMTDAEEHFNASLLHRQSLVDSSFEHLKARFARFAKPNEHLPEQAVEMVRVCSVLHNFLVEESDTIEKQWLSELDRAVNVKWPKSRQSFDFVKYDNDDNAIHIRRALAKFIFE